MAPQRPKSIPRQQSTRSAQLSSTETTGSNMPSAVPADTGFTSSKNDRRQIKRSLLLSRAALSSDRRTSGISKSSARRKGRMEKTKIRERLAADLGSLIDVLEVQNEEEGSNIQAAESSSHKATRARALASNNRSIKSKGGMQKRKAAISLLERQRMGKNLTVMSQGKRNESDETMSSNAEASRAEKWAALRRHIIASNGGKQNSNNE